MGLRRDRVRGDLLGKYFYNAPGGTTTAAAVPIRRRRQQQQVLQKSATDAGGGIRACAGKCARRGGAEVRGRRPPDPKPRGGRAVRVRFRADRERGPPPAFRRADGCTGIPLQTFATGGMVGMGWCAGQARRAGSEGAGRVLRRRSGKLARASVRETDSA